MPQDYSQIDFKSVATEVCRKGYLRGTMSVHGIRSRLEVYYSAEEIEALLNDWREHKREIIRALIAMGGPEDEITD